jgi:ankyrin repeat protein
MRYLFFAVPILLAAAPDDQGQRLLEAIHNGDTQAIRVALKAGASANTRGELGSTALMHASAYAPIECLRILLDAGAEVNAASDDGFTPLMWAASDSAKVQLLLVHKADVRARSKDGNTALILARQNGFTESVPVLLAAGAPDEDGMDAAGWPALNMSRDLLLQSRSIGAEAMHMAPVAHPVFNVVNLTGDPVEALRGMLDAGVDPNMSARMITLELPALAFAAKHGNLAQVRELLARGADPNRRGSHGLTPLMAAAVGEFQDTTVIDALLNKGADVNARDEMGRTALDWALLQGDTEIVRKLRAAGGRAMAPLPPAPSPVAEPGTPREAVEKALALLQPTGPRFFKQSGGCISCHNNSLPSMAAKRALDHNLAADRELAAFAAKGAMATWGPAQDKIAIGASSIGGIIANFSYELTAMAESGFAPNFVTDAAALALSRLQRSDGSWMIADTRPPLGGTPVEWTALGIRSLRAYTPKGLNAQRDEAVRRGRSYLLGARAQTALDEAAVVLGLHWAGGQDQAVAKSRERLLALQREDGGWAPLPTLGSNAFATGKALYALEAAGVKPRDAAYRRGVAYLLRTQLPDGSWFVQSRGLPFQPYQETGFPHGRNQFISSAATSWAIIALAPAAEAPKESTIR